MALMETQDRKRIYKSLVGIAINILLVALIIVILHSEARVEPGPRDKEKPTITNAQDALQAANDQLDKMTIGSISTIDGNDEENFTATLVFDQEIGDVSYWMLSDMRVMVHIDGATGEIISYFNMGWSDGDLTKTEVEVLANQIAAQFSLLPSDCSGPSSELRITYGETEYTDEGNTTTDYAYWIVQYDRVHNGISTEDHIVMLINKDGSLASYRKVWNMDLDGFSTSYSVTEAEAEVMATSHAGEGSIVHSTEKKIVRPNNFWTIGGFTYGLDPVCVYEIWVEGMDNSLFIYHVEGKDNEIVGGDFCYGYYEG